MITRITGTYGGKPVELTVEDGEITVEKRGAASAAARQALGAVRAHAEVAIPGVWSGVADLADPYALRATLVDVLDAGSAAFDSDQPLTSLGDAPAGAIF